MTVLLERPVTPDVLPLPYARVAPVPVTALSTKPYRHVTEKRLTAVLAELDERPSRIAAQLRDLGIVGVMGASANCPLANYLKLRFPNRFVSVAGRARVGGIACDLPLGVEVFIRRFDGGYHPELRRA